MNKLVSIITVLLLGLSFPRFCSAQDLVIIVNPVNNQVLQLDDVARIFLGKQQHFVDGDKLVPLDLISNNPAYEEFTKKVLKKTPTQLRAYWTKRIFTGKGKPPRQIDSLDELQSIIAANRTYLGYAPNESLHEDVLAIIVID